MALAGFALWQAPIWSGERTADTASQIETDWLTQATVRTAAPAAHLNVTTAEDAAGGCDGVKDGKWGFHTETRNEPSWWQVDLGKPVAIGRVLVFNRCETPTRTAALELLLSNDAKTWRQAYRHNGASFYGFTDGKPLSIPLKGDEARFVRFQLPANSYLHLDEVEVYGTADPAKNLALHQPADQSSVSQWSSRKLRPADPQYPIAQTIDRGRKLAADLGGAGVAVAAAIRVFDEVDRASSALKPDDPQQRPLYMRARASIRKLTLANPLLDFESIVFVKRAPASFSHMSDQYYSWWQRPGGGLCILEGFKTDSPRLRCLTEQFPPGNFLSPDLSYDARKILFAYCRHYPGRSEIRNKLDKEAQPEDSFFHIFEINVDGTGLRQLTRGRYDDTFPRYLPDGQIVFLSTRRGTFIQCGKPSATETLAKTMPDSFVRCGGDAYRPVSIYTMHVIDRNGGNMHAISAFESFEWDPSVGSDGRIYYARWDYVDRDNMPYMKLWATNPDGTSPRIVYGNFTKNPQCTFEARAIPNSRKLLLTASAHHAITGGSLVLFDPAGPLDGTEQLTRLSPEVCFPESEGWPESYFASPYPLSERCYLTAWSDKPVRSQGNTNEIAHLGLYLYDAFGNLELLYRDAAISSMNPLPLRPRPTPPVIASSVNWDGPQEGRFLLQNVYAGLTGVAPGTIKRLRIVAMPIKTQPDMNTPSIGITHDDPGKCILGTVPVESDGSAHFRVPSGVAVFFQALDDQNRAVQTMRTLTYVQPGQTLSCIGCHEGRTLAPVGARPLAASRAPSRLTPPPDGGWPFRYDRLVQGVLDRNCTSCHRPDAPEKAAARLDLTAAKSYDALIAYGKPSLIDHVRGAYYNGRSIPNAGASHTSALLAYLQKDKTHQAIKLDADAYERLVTWMDGYAQRQGSFSPQQEKELAEFRRQVGDLLEK